MVNRNYTIVTGLFDIGRGSWNYYRRTNEQYCNYFKNVLSLNAPMIIFTEPKFFEIVNNSRNVVDQSTIIIKTNVEDLYMEKYRELLFKIQMDPSYAVGHKDIYAPEITKPLYSLVTCSKLDLLRQGCKYSKTDYVIWLDGGYSHGNINISRIDWNPTRAMKIKDKISLINVSDISNIDDDPVEFCKKSIAVINGGFIGGYKNVIYDISNKYYEMVDYQLKELNLKQDDQVVWEYMLKKYPQLFNLISGGWYDAFKLT
jgi:protein YibB